MKQVNFPLKKKELDNGVVTLERFEMKTTSYCVSIMDDETGDTETHWTEDLNKAEAIFEVLSR